MPKFKIAVGLCLLSLFAIVLHGSARAQMEEPKLDVGLQISGLAGDGFGARDAGGGGVWVTYYPAKYVAIEGALNYLSANSSDRFTRFQGQFGVKTGVRFKRFGVFGKARPGFIYTRQDLPIVIFGPPIILSSDLGGYTGFSLDVGGVAEIYPSRHFVLRVDVGDTIVTRREAGIIIFRPGQGAPNSPIFSPGGTVLPRRNFATHNLQVSVGVGFRF